MTKTKEKKPFRCKVGFHKWIELGTNLLLSDQVSQCQGCKIGKHTAAFGQAQFIYTAEAMKEAWDAGKITNEAAKRLIYGPGEGQEEDPQLSLFPTEMIAKASKSSCCDKAHQ